MSTLRLHRKFASSFLSTPRDLIVYLPVGYATSGERYPVLYLQDGQNLFDPATAFLGNHWRVRETADALIREGVIRPLIVVGVYNTGVRRVSEYTPTRCPRRHKGGKAARYAQTLARDVKPFIDREYRTLKGAQHTGVGGSSLGALASLTAVLEYPGVFGKAALISPSVWWDQGAILRHVERFTGNARARIWLDMGTQEGEFPERQIEDARALRDALKGKGFADLEYREVAGAGHNEHAWAARLGEVLRFLFPR